MAQRVGRGIALLFHDHGTRRGEWSAARPGRTLPPGKTQYPFYRRLHGPQGWSGRAENLVPTGIQSRTVQPVVSRYTDWATWPMLFWLCSCLMYTMYLVCKKSTYFCAALNLQFSFPLLCILSCGTADVVLFYKIFGGIFYITYNKTLRTCCKWALFAQQKKFLTFNYLLQMRNDVQLSESLVMQCMADDMLFTRLTCIL